MPRGRRRSRRSRRGGRTRSDIQDIVEVVLDPATTIPYTSNNVPVTGGRPYRIRAITGYFTASGPAMVQVSIYDPNSRLAQRRIASTGPIIVGTVPRRVHVRAPEYEMIPSNNDAGDLAAVDNLCFIKTIKNTVVGVLYVYIEYGKEQLAESCPTVLYGRSASPPLSSSWADDGAEEIEHRLRALSVAKDWRNRAGTSRDSVP